MSIRTMNRRDFARTLGASGLGLAAGLGLSAGYANGRPSPQIERPPNFVVIFTDDQGYQDLGCFGSPDIATPNLDRMAGEGMKLTDFHVASPVCSPSRAALLTGRYPPRTGVFRVLFPRDNVGIHEDEITIAEMLKAHGYATACFGKWHLGHLPPFLPTRHGFDEYFGLPYSNDMLKPPLPLVRNEEIIETNPDQSLLTRKYTRHATDFIRRHRDEPFFLYLPHTMPHVPLFASERFRGRSRRGLYGDVIEEIDWSVGQVLETIRDCGLDENTLVVFTSDNGPWLVMGDRGGSALPLRAGKSTAYEGGMRVPCIARWPGRIPAGAVCDEMASTLDLLPTVAQFAGIEAPTDRVIDGQNISALLTGCPDARTPHDFFCYYVGMDLRAIRRGEWKLHRAVEGKKPPELYDLSFDIAERNNLAGRVPERAAELEALAAEFDGNLKADARTLVPYEGEAVT